ncbi:MAG: FlgB family protein [Paracoccaceae bacterium]
MTPDIDILRISHALASHSARRQTVIANNIANADTPGYRARDIPRFSGFLDNSGDFTQRATRNTHIATAPDAPGAPKTIFSDAEKAPNGNTVSLPLEMMKAAELRQDYELALGVYRKSIDILRASLGRR